MEAVELAKQLDDIGTVGIAIFTAYVILSLGMKAYAFFKVKNAPPLECQTDPSHYRKIDDLHKWTKNTEERKNRGDFACQFKDRDEVRDFKEILVHNAQATDRLSKEMRVLANEIRATRVSNGSQA